MAAIGVGTRFINPDSSERELSRRGLFSAAAFAALWANASSPRAGAVPPSASGDVEPNSILRKLLRRITFGITPEDLALANALGYAPYLEYQLNHTAIDDSASEAMLADLPTLNMPAYVLFAQSPGAIYAELAQATILRSIHSKRQLFQRMVELWTDHFHIDGASEPARYIKTVDDRAVVRPNALGFFPSLLRASAHSPAMLVYLNSDLNVAGVPNENYSRELMELHTLGAGGGYTQQDVVEVARCFTGWGIVPRSTTDVNSGTFQFDPAHHDNGQKVVLGNIIPAGGGQQDGETVLNILAAHPSTAKRVAGKICRWFYGEDAPQALINSVASIYTATGGDIKAMIRGVLSPNVLQGAMPRFKRPYHLFISALRVLPHTITNSAALRHYLFLCGHEPFTWPAPSGYPDTFDHWSGGLLSRWNFGASLMASHIGGTDVDYTILDPLITAQDVVDWIEERMFAGEMSPAEKERTRQFMLPDPPYISVKREAVGLAIATPGFQWY